MGVSGKWCETPRFPMEVFNEYALGGRVLSRVFDRFLIVFEGESEPRRYLLSELALTGGRSGGFCVGHKAFAVALTKGETLPVGALGSDIRGVPPNFDIDGDVEIRGIYGDGSVVVESSSSGAIRRVSPYILASKEGASPNGGLRPGDTIAWIGGRELTIRGVFALNGDIAVSRGTSSRRTFRLPTSVLLVKEESAWKGYSVGDTLAHPYDAREGIVRAIGIGRNALYVEPTNYPPEAVGPDRWRMGLDEWPIAVPYEVLDRR